VLPIPRGLLVAAFLAAVPAFGLSAQDIPTPTSVLGFEVGADFHLATYEESVAYFEALARASDRVRLVPVGRTSEGRPWVMAVISDPSNLDSLEQFRQIAHRLAHPAGLDDAEARALAHRGRAFVHIDGGLHASEVAGAQHTIELAYQLVSGVGTTAVDRMLKETVVLLWPSLNPDGQDIVVDWYRENVGTPYEVAPLHRLYQRYIGHDNNRDAYMLNMIESRVVARAWRYWEPQIIYVQHQSSPFPTRIWLPPFAEPIANHAPPLMSRTVNVIGMTIAEALESRGRVGATHMGTGFDAWYPGYIDYLPMLQNIAAFWTETALYRYATPHFYTIGDFPRNRQDLRPESLYPSPWPGGWWRLRDAVDYMVIASMAVIDYAARYREEVLYNRYQSGRDIIRKYRQEPPFAYFIPRDQPDPTAPVALLQRLAFNGIEIRRLARNIRHEGLTYPAGTWVIPMDQPFAEYVRELFDPQSYPDLREYPDGPPEQPYDAAGWTLPWQMGVRVVAATQPLDEAVRAALEPVNTGAAAWQPGDSTPPAFTTHPVAGAVAPLPGRVRGSGSALALSPAQNNTFRAVNRALAAGGTVRFAPDSSGGRYLIAGVGPERIARWTQTLFLQGTRTALPTGPPVARRIGLYRPWSASIDEGWTRWLLEQYGFPVRAVRNAEIRSGSLRSRYDVLILAADRPGTILRGFRRGVVPPRYAGGIGAEGVRALDRFVRDGGTLVCFNQSSNFAIEQLHLPVVDVVDTLDRKDFFVSGSILEVNVNRSHPVMAGMPARADIFVDRSPVFDVNDGFEGTALATYATEGSPLRSGYLLGEQHLQGMAAALDVRHGAGHVVLIGFRPQWRGQPFGTFRVVFNAALYGGALARTVHGDADFWHSGSTTHPDTASTTRGTGQHRPSSGRTPNGGRLPLPLTPKP